MELLPETNNLIELLPEIEEGNIEYKRHLINLDVNRIEQLSTQMKWRLAEGNNEAIYYLGVDDNGSPYNLLDDEIKETLNNFTILLEKNNARIINFEVINKENQIKPTISYIKITIRTKTFIYPEIRIVLLGDSLSGKTTFLSNILLNKVDKSYSESRLYLMNHKHELETKKTSSFNCYYKIWDGIKYTFMEAPGDDEYTKTRYKILLGTHPNICLIFSNSDNKYNDKYLNIVKNLKIPNILINTFDELSKYNCTRLINKNNLFNIIKTTIKTNNDQKQELAHIQPNPNSKTIFNVLNVYSNIDQEIIVSGFLSSGKIELNNIINWYDKNKSARCKIKSIYINSEPIKEIYDPSMISICLQPSNTINKLKYGILSSVPITQINKITFNYIKLTSNDANKELPFNMIGYCENKLVYLNNIIKIANKYQASINNYYEGDGPIIIDNKFYQGVFISTDIVNIST